MNISSQHQIAMDIAVEQVLLTLRSKVASTGTFEYKAKSPNGDAIKLTLYRRGLFPKDGQINCRIWLTMYHRATDGSIHVQPSQYEFRHNEIIVKRFVPDSTGTKKVYDRDSTIGDLLDLNSYLLTWEEVPPVPYR